MKMVIYQKEQKIIYELDDSIKKSYTLLGDGKPIISPEKIKITGAKTDIDRIGAGIRFSSNGTQ